MKRRFKNALCLEQRPDVMTGIAAHHRCKRRADHSGPHRRVYRDAIALWNDKDKEATIVPRKES